MDEFDNKTYISQWLIFRIWWQKSSTIILMAHHKLENSQNSLIHTCLNWSFIKLKTMNSINDNTIFPLIFQNLAAEKTYNNLDVTLKEANEHRNEWFEGVHTCKRDDSLFAVMETIVKAEVHRLVIIDGEGKVCGVVSLSDILSFLVLRPSGMYYLLFDFVISGFK